MRHEKAYQSFEKLPQDEKDAESYGDRIRTRIKQLQKKHRQISLLRDLIVLFAMGYILFGVVFWHYFCAWKQDVSRLL